MSPDRLTNRRTWPIWTMLLALLILGGTATYFAADSSSAGHAADRSTQIQGCRAEANARVTRAADARDDAETDVVNTIAGIVIASLRHDETTARSLAPVLDTQRVELAGAKAAKRAVVNAYQAEIRLSRTNPDRFLHDCRSHP